MNSTFYRHSFDNEEFYCPIPQTSKFELCSCKKMHIKTCLQIVYYDCEIPRDECTITTGNDATAQRKCYMCNNVMLCDCRVALLEVFYDNAHSDDMWNFIFMFLSLGDLIKVASSNKILMNRVYNMQAYKYGRFLGGKINLQDPDAYPCVNEIMDLVLKTRHDILDAIAFSPRCLNIETWNIGMADYIFQCDDYGEYSRIIDAKLVSLMKHIPYAIDSALVCDLPGVSENARNTCLMHKYTRSYTNANLIITERIESFIDDINILAFSNTKQQDNMYSKRLTVTVLDDILTYFRLARPSVVLFSEVILCHFLRTYGDLLEFIQPHEITNDMCIAASKSSLSGYPWYTVHIQSDADICIQLIKDNKIQVTDLSMGALMDEQIAEYISSLEFKQKEKSRQLKYAKESLERLLKARESLCLTRVV